MTPDRFFSLLLALQSRESTTTVDLASQVGVSARTLLRDLRWLQEAGFPLHVQRGRWGGVTLLPGGSLDTSRLTPAERDNLALVGLDHGQRERLGVAGESRRAQRKVTPSRSVSREEALPLSAVVTTDNTPWFGADHAGTPPGALVGDLRRGVRLRILYRGSRDAEATWRVVDPYGLLAKSGRWYLVADTAGTPRLHLLERLADWVPLRTPRRLRTGTTLASAARESTELWESGGAVTVHAVLDVRQLDRARRILGSRLTVRSPVDDDRVEIRIAYREREDVRQLLQFGKQMTVTGPEEVRERIRQLATEILEQYP